MLEEFPGLRRRRRTAAREGERESGADGPSHIELAVLRLMSEGRRIAFRVIVLAQRSKPGRRADREIAAPVTAVAVVGSV
jgi:hypothetical protein